jgi:hypothetical protein
VDGVQERERVRWKIKETLQIRKLTVFPYVFCGKFDVTWSGHMNTEGMYIFIAS